MKRPVDDDQQQQTPEKRIKLEDDANTDLQIVEPSSEDEGKAEEWKPTHIVLSNEAFSVSTCQ